MGSIMKTYMVESQTMTASSSCWAGGLDLLGVWDRALGLLAVGLDDWTSWIGSSASALLGRN